MGLFITADPRGLQAMAGRLEALAGELATASVPAGAGPSYQATSAAVSTVHGGVGLAGATLAARMQATAAKVASSGMTYAGQDNNSATRISTVAPTVTV